MSLEISFDLPLPQTPSFSLVTSLASSSQSGKPIKSIVLPWIRESTFGHTLGMRSNALAASLASTAACGMPDLVHWGRHYGERSSKFNHNEFAPPASVNHSKQEDGYVGYFHFCNGIDYAGGASVVEEYVLSAVGLESRPEGYFWAPTTDVASFGVYNNRQMVVTLCTYNAFSRTELRARFLILVPKSKRLQVPVDCLYNLTSHALKKLHSYSRSTIGELPHSFWLELAVLALVRLFYAADDPSHQVCGTVNIPAQVQFKQSVYHAIDRVVALLPKGHLTGYNEAGGVPTACGEGYKVNRYKNRLVDSLKRLVLLDISGDAGDYAIQLIQSSYGAEFDYVVCQLLQAQHSKNNDQAFLSLVHQHLKHDPSLTQAALLMVEQVRFLLARELFVVAEKVAVRAVSLLPLDFDCWFHLALCHILGRKYERALQTINSLPVVFAKQRLSEDSVDGVYDAYATCYMERMVVGQPVGMETFEKFFPPPKSELQTDEGSVQNLWYLEFVRRPHMRHPICGPFYQSPLSCATPLEISAVDASIVKVCGSTSPRHILSSKSSSNPWSSILDFDRTSTWGRAYDLITIMVAMIGWDNVVHTKAKAFRRASDDDDPEYVVDHATCSRDECQPWLDQLFLVVYDDIRTMMTVTNDDNHRSALAWEMIGLVGWSCKYKLKDSISSIVTSVVGVAADGGFDYFGTVKMLEIYNEFVLSDVESSSIDSLTGVYDNRVYSNKMILQSVSAQVYEEYVHYLTREYLSVELVLLHLMKYVSWNLRWYQYIPDHLATNTLIKLCIKFDFIYIRSMLRVVYETYKTQPVKKTASKFSMQLMFGTTPSKPQKNSEFAESDTVVEYMERLINWIESMQA